MCESGPNAKQASELGTNVWFRFIVWPCVIWVTSTSPCSCLGKHRRMTSCEVCLGMRSVMAVVVVAFFPESSVAFLRTIFVPAGCSNASGSHYEIVVVRFVDPPGYVSGEVALIELVKLCEAFVGRRSRARDVLRDRDWQQAQGNSLAAEVPAFVSFLEFVHLISFVWQRGDFDHIHERASFGAESVNPLCGTDKVIR